MATTKNGRILKLMKRIAAKPERVTNKRTPECYITINYFALGKAETERRATEIKRLHAALGEKKTLAHGGFEYTGRIKKGGPGAKKKIKAPKEGSGKRKKK